MPKKNKQRNEAISLRVALKNASANSDWWKIVLDADDTNALEAAALGGFTDEWFRIVLNPEKDENGRQLNSVTIIGELAGVAVDSGGLWTITIKVPKDQSINVGALSLMTHRVINGTFTFDDNGHAR